MKKLNIKILIIVLIVLAAVFALSRIFRSPGLESNLRKTLVALDTAVVTEVRIQPSNNRTTEIKLFKEGKNWMVIADKQKSVTDNNSVKMMLGQLLDLRTQRLASRKKEKWKHLTLATKERM